MLTSYYFLCFIAWLVMQNNSVETPFNMLATSRSCGNVCFFDQMYQPGKIILQVSVLIIKYLVSACLLDKVTCAVFLVFENCMDVW